MGDFSSCCMSRRCKLLNRIQKQEKDRGPYSRKTDFVSDRCNSFSLIPEELKMRFRFCGDIYHFKLK